MKVNEFFKNRYGIDDEEANELISDIQKTLTYCPKLDASVSKKACELCRITPIFDNIKTEGRCKYD